MRSVYYKNIDEKLKKIVISGDAFHHLVNVVRLKNNETILLLNGQGLKVKSKVELIEKKTITLSLEEFIHEKDKRNFSMLLGLPKKDTCEHVVRDIVELGIHEFIPWKSTYSQWSWAPSERLNKIMVSALEQSNNSYFPDILPQIEEESDLHLLLQCYDKVFVFDSLGESKNIGVINSGTKQHNKILFVIGPEGGLSLMERNLLKTFSNVAFITLPIPILRTETAVSVIYGYLLSFTQSAN